MKSHTILPILLSCVDILKSSSALTAPCELVYLTSLVLTESFSPFSFPLLFLQKGYRFNYSTGRLYLHLAFLLNSILYIIQIYSVVPHNFKTSINLEFKKKELDNSAPTLIALCGVYRIKSLAEKTF